MENLTLDEIVNSINGKIYINANNNKYNNLSTDTRKITKDSIFIALKGENFNGNDYVDEASKKGANLCIVEEIKFKASDLNGNTSVVLVDDTKKALLDLAEYYRSKLKIKVIGITGSTGKTSTKDLTAAALSKKFKVFKTKGNFNNDIGLPLMIFQLDNSYDVAVLEMGMSNFGEIHKLAKTARPDIAIITNIGISHIENLKSRENILKAKMEITDFFTKENILIINGENDLLSTISSKDYKIIKVGFNDEDFIGKNIYSDENHIEFTLEHEQDHVKFNIPVPGKHNVLNSLLAIAAAKTLDVGYEDLKEGIKNLNATSMRLDIVKGEKFTIIDDCYNASPDSMKAALDVMSNMNTVKRKVAVLGTMKELGTESYMYHREVGEYARNKGVDFLITVGEFNEAYKEGFNNDENFRGFNSVEDASEFVVNAIKDKDCVLVKASRSMKFEAIVNKLKYKNF